MKKALICGISGQDGAYLAKFLLKNSYKVCGTSRDAEICSFSNLELLGIRQQVNLESMSLNDFRSVLQVLANIQPDEIYNLAGLSSVALSFQQPVETVESVSIGTLNLLEAIRISELNVRFYNACSSECFGEYNGKPADEKTPFRPKSPYGVAKAAAFWQVLNYREAYGLYACSGILSNHESPLRAERFVTKKIVATACRIAARSREKLHLGNLSIERDWGWAPEYVEAMWLMLNQETPDDFVIATGESHTLEEFLSATFTRVGLDWRDHVVENRSLLRPLDVAKNRANPKKAKELLGWEAKYKMKDVVRMMVEAEQHSLASSGYST
jgi:GDPmannose 4,6-dehydratase